MAKRGRKTEVVKVSDHNVGVMTTFREAIKNCGLTPEEEAHISKELEAVGVASVTIAEIKRRQTILRTKMKESKEYQAEKKLKAKLKQVEEMQKIKTAMVVGVIKTKAAGKDIKGLSDVVGLLEGEKQYE